MIHTLALLLAFSFTTIAFAADPIGVLEVPHGAKMPSKDLAVFSTVGYRGEEPSSDLLVWEKSGTELKPKYRVRDRKGNFHWLEPIKASYSTVESALTQSTSLIIQKEKWDGKLRKSAGGSEFQTIVHPIPPVLRFDAALDFGPPKCKETGSVQGKSGSVWKKESCEAGRNIDIFETPNGPRIQGYQTRETEMPLDFLSYSVPVSFEEKVRQAVLVYEQKDGWARVRSRSSPRRLARWAWIRLSSTSGKVSPLSEKAKKSAIEQDIELKRVSEEAADRSEFWVKARQVSHVKDQSWVQLDIYEEDPCSFPSEKTILGTGWVPLMANAGSLLVSTTTCD